MLWEEYQLWERHIQRSPWLYGLSYKEDDEEEEPRDEVKRPVSRSEYQKILAEETPGALPNGTYQ